MDEALAILNLKYLCYTVAPYITLGPYFSSVVDKKVKQNDTGPPNRK